MAEFELQPPLTLRVQGYAKLPIRNVAPPMVEARVDVQGAPQNSPRWRTYRPESDSGAHLFWRAGSDEEVRLDEPMQSSTGTNLGRCITRLTWLRSGGGGGGGAGARGGSSLNFSQ